MFVSTRARARTKAHASHKMIEHKFDCVEKAKSLNSSLERFDSMKLVFNRFNAENQSPG